MRGGEESKHDHHLILETMAENQFQTELATQPLTPLCLKLSSPDRRGSTQTLLSLS